ncbi:hypothetical protein HDV00_005986 [Rhizophlyctis rosea]|nr:hypothetical protein HDV00_005986 [Rhizophlyctis rosea]
MTSQTTDPELLLPICVLGEATLATLLRVAHPSTTSVSDLKKLVAAELFPDLPLPSIPRLKLFDVTAEGVDVTDARLSKSCIEDAEILAAFPSAVALNPFEMVAARFEQQREQNGSVRLLVVPPPSALVPSPNLAVDFEPPPYRPRTAIPSGNSYNQPPPLSEDISTQSGPSTGSSKAGIPTSHFPLPIAMRSWDITPKTGILDEMMVVASAVATSDASPSNSNDRAMIPLASLSVADGREPGVPQADRRGSAANTSPQTEVQNAIPSVHGRDDGAGSTPEPFVMHVDKDPLTSSPNDKASATSRARRKKRLAVGIVILLVVILVPIIVGVLIYKRSQHPSDNNSNTSPSTTPSQSTPIPSTPPGPSNFTGHTHFVMSLALLPDTNHLISASWDGSIRIWDIKTGTATIYQISLWAPSFIALNGNGTRLWGGGGNGNIWEWAVNTDSGTGNVTLATTGRTMTYGSLNVTSIVLASDNGRTIGFTATKNATVGVWDLDKNPNNPLWDLTVSNASPPSNKTTEVTSIAIIIDANGYRVYGGLTGSIQSDPDIVHWNVGTGFISPIGSQPLTSSQYPTTTLLLSPPSPLLYAGHTNGYISIWNTTTNTLITELKESSQGVTSLAITPDGKTLIAGLANGRIRWWDTGSGSALGFLSDGAHVGGVECLVVSGDGKWVFSGGADGMIRRWALS